MKLLLLTLLSAFVLPNAVNAEPASRYKFTCDDFPCTENELTALKLVNENYGKKLENRLKNNTYYSHPWYWVYKEKWDCKYTVAAKEDMPTHTVTMEWIHVDICEKTTELIDLGRRR